MACEILVHRNQRNYSHTDLEKDRRGVYKKGYIVVGKTLPHVGWGNKEKFSAGNFVHIRITDATWEELSDYAESWRLFIDYELVGSNLSIDGHRFRIYSTNPGISGRGNLTLLKIENYLNKWNVEIFSNTTNEVVIDIIITDMLKSPSFWDYVSGEGLEDLQYNQTSYNQTTGEHIIDIDYSNVRPEIEDRTVIASKINRRLLNRNITVTNHDPETQTGTISVLRSEVLKYFRDEVKRDVANIALYRREYYIDEFDVDSLVQYSENHNGEPYEVTKTQFINYMKSQLNRSDA